MQATEMQERVASQSELATPMLLERSQGVQAWTASTLQDRSWIVDIDAEARRELEYVLSELRANPIEMLMLRHDSFDLPACRAMMDKVRSMLDDGIMFAVVNKLDLDTMSPEEGRQLYWLLASLLANPVAQRFCGQMTFEVLDRMVPIVPGSGIRPTVTNADLTFHSDNSYNDPHPDYIALFCMGVPMSGGISKVASLYSVNNRLLESHLEDVPRLYQPFPYDRYKEHAPGLDGVTYWPVLSYRQGRLWSRVALPEIAAGYALLQRQMDDSTRRAVQALKSVFAEEDISAQFSMERGQIQFANNKHALHSRTDFVDAPDGSSRRHLMRLWLRKTGSRTYTGKGPQG